MYYFCVESFFYHPLYHFVNSSFFAGSLYHFKCARSFEFNWQIKNYKLRICLTIYSLTWVTNINNITAKHTRPEMKKISFITEKWSLEVCNVVRVKWVLSETVYTHKIPSLPGERSW